MSNHDRHIQRAIDIAATSTQRWMLGSVITRNGNILSQSTNKFRNHPSINHRHASYHAEMAALRKCLRTARGGTIYIARTNNQGQARLARPCIRCMKGLLKAGVSTVIYTNGLEGYTIERLNSNSMSSRVSAVHDL